MDEKKIIDTTPMNLAQQAANILKLSQEATSLSLLELSVVFRIAAMTCDEANSMYERAQMANKIRGWSPGK